VGRLKEVVNRNGFKISLSEIAAALFGMPSVEESASFALPEAVTGERLAVAVLSKQGSAIDLENVVAYLRRGGVASRRLPEELHDAETARTEQNLLFIDRQWFDQDLLNSCVGRVET
jgi:non-ribosomal peptide synthetase component E (peptide arylation enzyme)